MGCGVSGEQLWSWVDQDAPELEEHLAVCPSCREKAGKIREEIGLLAGEDAEFPVPDKIGPYTIRRLIGEGGQALVYEAEQPSPQRAVALKLLKGGHLVDKSRLRHFRREIQSLARLTHPGIATIYEAGRTPEGLHYFSMELVNGVPLHTYVREKKPTRRERLGLFQKVCEAVHYAHDRGVVHRDLKPSNIMVTADGEPKILDFGLARLTQSDAATSLSVTREGHVEGTPRYMSPEQLRGEQGRIDHRTDVYALGVILYELLTGTPPRTITTVSQVTIDAICDQVPRLPSSVDSSVHGDLDAIVIKALEKRPEDRYSSAKDLEGDISRHLEGAAVEAKRPGAFYSLRKKLSGMTPPARVGVVAIVITTLVAGLAYTIWRGIRPPSDALDDRLALVETRSMLLAEGPSEFIFRQCENAIFRYPGVDEATLINAQAYHLRRRRSQAAAVLTNAIARDRSQWAYRYLLAEIESKQKPASGGAPVNAVWTGDLASSADAWYWRSFATLNIDSALVWAKQAVYLEPQHLLALTTVAYLAEIERDIESFMAATDELVRQECQADVWLARRITNLLSAGRVDESLSECDRITDTWPNHYRGYFFRARVARRMGRYADAERDFSTAIEKMGDSRYETAWMLYHRGSVRWLMGREEGAADDYETAYRRLGYPTFANARLYVLLHELGRQAEADAAMAEARTANADDVWLGRIFDCLTGTLNPTDLAAIAESTGNAVTVCEGYYYAGEASWLAGKTNDACEWFEKCVKTGVECDPSNVLESQSEFQLARMRLSQNANSESTTAEK